MIKGGLIINLHLQSKNFFLIYSADNVFNDVVD